MSKRNTFVPDGESRKETATVLVATAYENSISQRSISPTQGGFWVTEELADLIFGETAPEPEPGPEPAPEPAPEPEPEPAPKKSGPKKKTTEKKED